MADEDAKAESKGAMQKRHAKEVKDLQQKTAKMLKDAKSGKEKKELQQQIKDMEEDLAKKHAKELKKLQKRRIEEAEEDGVTILTDAEKEQERQRAEEEEEERKRKHNEKLQQKQQQKRKDVKDKQKQLEQDILASGGTERERELNSIKEKLAPLGLAVKDIPADGHCLFRAVADQIPDRVKDFAQARKIIADYLRTHYDDFIPFMETPEGDLMSKSMYQNEISVSQCVRVTKY